MPRNLVICCDGTGNDFGERKSNVTKLYKAIVCNADQVAYYHPGVGTMGARNALTSIGKSWTKIIGLAFGYGISDNVADAYQFLMRTFKPDDRIFVFGFSRGAYTARALCGMLHMIGLLTPGNEALIPYSIRMVKARKLDFGVAADFKQTFSRECKPYFLGLWDTVSSVGWVYDAVRFPFTASNPDIQVIRHAVSIDERRAFFRQNLFALPQNPQQDLREIWFAGVHSDVGGSYPESESQLSQISFQWMICEAELSGLLVDPVRRSDLLGMKPPYVVPDPATTNQHESLCGLWWIAELWPKIVHLRTAQGTWKKRIHLNLGSRRKIFPGVGVHTSVEQRIVRAVPRYNPGNLPPDRHAVPDRCPENGAVGAVATSQQP